MELPIGDWALFGSGPLLLRGWINHVGDLDVISRGPAYARARELGTPDTPGSSNVIYRIGGDVTVGNHWEYGEPDIDRMIDTAEIIDGVPCVRLEHVVTYKRIADRPRDREHLAIIEAHL